MTVTTTRNATLADLAALLTDQKARQLDLVVPATKLWSDGAILSVIGSEPVITPDGVTQGDGRYTPTAVCDEGLSEKMSIPLAYLRRMRETRPDLYDANLNGWWYGQPDVEGGAGPDTRSFLLRTFKPDTPGETGIARALLSDRYSRVDHLDVLTAGLTGVRNAGVDTVIHSCDLTERRMTVRVVAPGVQAMAETLLAGYRNPFGSDFDRWRDVANREGLGFGGTEPVVFAGFRISNSETGNGAWSITPEARIKVCANGLVLNTDVVRGVHTGGKLDAGIIEWSHETHQKNLELITAKTADAVRTFLSEGYLVKAIARLEAKAGEPVETPDEVKTLTKPLGFTDDQVAGILGHFIRGGQTTKGGVVNAITSYAQMVDDPDAAYVMETKATTLLGV